MPEHLRHRAKIVNANLSIQYRYIRQHIVWLLRCLPCGLWRAFLSKPNKILLLIQKMYANAKLSIIVFALY